MSISCTPRDADGLGPVVERKNQLCRQFYNVTKARWEIWIRRSLASQFILWNAIPARRYDEQFVAAWSVGASVFPVFGELMWWGAAGGPTGGLVAGSMAAVNEIGGGLDLITRGANGDWVHLDWNDIYPTLVRKSPHLKTTINLPDVTNIHSIVGLVGATNKPADTDNPYPANFPDDGIYFEVNTGLANPWRCVTMAGGVATVTDFGAVPTGHFGAVVRVNDAGNQALFLSQDQIIARHNTNLPVGVQLEPYYMIRSLEAAVKNIHLHDFRLIFDRGF